MTGMTVRIMNHQLTRHGKRQQGKRPGVGIVTGTRRRPPSVPNGENPKEYIDLGAGVDERDARVSRENEFVHLRCHGGRKSLALT